MQKTGADGEACARQRWPSMDSHLRKKKNERIRSILKGEGVHGVLYINYQLAINNVLMYEIRNNLCEV